MVAIVTGLLAEQGVHTGFGRASESSVYCFAGKAPEATDSGRVIGWISEDLAEEQLLIRGIGWAYGSSNWALGSSVDSLGQRTPEIISSKGSWSHLIDFNRL